MKLIDQPEETVGRLMYDITRLWRRNFQWRAREFGLTRTQWAVLALLARNEGINQAALADLAELEPISLVRILDKLESAGLVERRPDPGDRRARLIFFRRSADDTLGRIWEKAAEVRTEALTGLSVDEVATLRGLLEKVKVNLVEGEAVRSGAVKKGLES